MRDYLVVVAFMFFIAIATLYLLTTNQPLLIELLVKPMFKRW
jgi:hypothetical protein